MNIILMERSELCAIGSAEIRDILLNEFGASDMDIIRSTTGFIHYIDEGWNYKASLNKTITDYILLEEERSWANRIKAS